MELFRAIGFEVGEPAMNMALDEAIAMAVGTGRSPPTIRLYGWKPSAVSIGYFQEVLEVVDLEFCHSRSIEVVRRLTGGGAVLHTPGELTYSFSVSDMDPAVPQDIQGSYLKICSPIVSVLRKLGANAAFRPINDIEIEGRKVSGNAQTRRFGAVMQHGTILLDIDASLLGALKASPEKLSAKGVRDHRGRVTTLKETLKKVINHKELSEGLIDEFCRQFGCEAEWGKPSYDELSRVPSLSKRYGSIDWLFRR